MGIHQDTRSWLGALALGLGLGFGTFGCMTGPIDGQLVGSAAGTALPFGGVYDKKGITISLQVLDAPDSATPVWVEFDQTVTSMVGKSYPANTLPLYYEWSKTVTPAALDTIGKARWPIGGVLHVRAVAKDPAVGGNYVLPVTDEDRNACFGAHPADNWVALTLDCGKVGTRGAGVADIERTPADTFSGHTVPPYLTKKKVVYDPLDPQLLNTAQYYAAVGVPTSLLAFQAKFGFLDGTGNPVAAKYYNYGDLGIGRDMHCAVKNGSTACYVSNFAPAAVGGVTFGDEDGSLALLNTPGAKPFATVGMIYTPPITAPNSVKFVVYNPAGDLQYNAKLDSKGANDQIPGNCLSCHGGASSYDPATHSVASNAHFLPFDVSYGLHFGDGATSYDPQAEAIRKLNAMVYDAGATPAIQEMLDGTYPPSVHTANAQVDPTFVPTGWNDSEPHQKLYRSVVAPYCRTCHVSQAQLTGKTPPLKTSALDFTTFTAFDTFAGTIKVDVCQSGSKGFVGHVMPHAEQTLINFWNSPARAHLTTGIAINTSCSPN